MGAEAKPPDQWMDYLREATESGVFDAIENSILVATSEFPDEFRRRRDRIVKLLFAKRSPPSRRTDEAEEEQRTVGEVLRIKKILSDGKEQLEGPLCESLGRLRIMDLNVDTLQNTGVGKVVNRLKKHPSNRISELARNLVDQWKEMVGESIKPTLPIPQETELETADPTTSQMDNGPPLPPLEEETPVNIETNSIDFPEPFYDMDDKDGEPEFDNIDRKGKGRQENLEFKIPNQPGNLTNYLSEEYDCNKRGETLRTACDQKLESNAQKRPTSALQNNCSEEFLLSQERLERAKRKLRQGYEQAERAKKQRTIKLMEFHDLPKPHPLKTPPKKFGNRTRK